MSLRSGFKLNASDLHTRVKSAVMNTEWGVNGLEQALRSFNRKSTVSQDEMLLAFNRMKVSDLGLNDVRDFYLSVKRGSRKP